MDGLSFNKGDLINKEQAIELALFLAGKGRGRVEPNPCVGAVLFNEETGRLIDYGYHEVYGGSHAEVNALKSTHDASGLSLVVTLEPCSHFGKTPPCAQLLVEKKVSKLIYIDEDPNPLVAGKGLSFLKENGLEIEKAPREYSDLNHLLNHKFFYSFENKKSYVHLKWAQSLDGKMHLNGESKWITNKESRDYGHFLRAQSQAILVGRKTLEQDNPLLNVRLEGYEKTPQLIVIDPKLKLVGELERFEAVKIRKPEDVIVITQDSPRDLNLKYNLLKAPMSKEGLDLNYTREKLYKDYKLQSIFVEGGALTLAGFINQKAFNRASVFVAPKALGVNGIGPFDYVNNQNINEEAFYKKTKTTKVFGDNILWDFLF